MFDKKKYMTKYRIVNKLKIKHQKAIYDKIYRSKNHEKKLEYDRLYRIQNKDKIILGRKIHRLKNHKEIDRKNNIYVKNREKIDTQFKIINRLRHRVNMVCKAKNVKKNFRFKEYIGCSPAKLIAHLESKFSFGMTKKNYGKWHIDHIKPCAAFDKNDPMWQLKCFHYTNLQPLWAKDNIIKGDKYTEL